MKRALGPIWMLVAWILLIMFVYCLVIYGFDIHVAKGGRKKAIVAMFANEESDERFYAIDDEYGFEVDYEWDDPYAVMTFNKYDVTDFPFCLTCGWYGHTEGIRIWDPHRNGNLIYGIDPKDSEWMNEGMPMGSYATFDLQTKEEGYVMDLDEIGPNAEDDKYSVTKDFVESNFEEISYFGGDDIDCAEAFMAIYAVFILLFVWAIIAWIIYRIRKARGKIS